jgi:hypothetical protein
MPHLRNTKDSVRIHESYDKDTLKDNGYTFDGRGFWYKLTKDIESLKDEYTFLQELGVDLPREGVALMKKWSTINRWFDGPKRGPAREMIF